MPCPDCVEANSSRSSIQLCILPNDQKKITGRAASFASYARRCVRCGLVYVRSSPPHRLGWLDGTKGRGFHPAPDYA
jgi:rubredoxin